MARYPLSHILFFHNSNSLEQQQEEDGELPGNYTGGRKLEWSWRGMNWFEFPGHEWQSPKYRRA